MHRINEVLNRIEEQLTEDISYRELAEMMSMSIYEFRRVFALVVGTPLADYIRKRRLSCAVFDLQTGGMSITQIAGKYGYESPSSFSRAFREMQGLSPSAAMQQGVQLHVFPRASFTMLLSGADQIGFRLMRREAMKICGYTGIFSESPSGCGEEVWNAYYDGGYHERLVELGAFAKEGREFAGYVNQDDMHVRCSIGALVPVDFPTPEGMSELPVPSALWGVFEVVGTMDQQINAAYVKTLTDWLAASIYQRDPSVCNLEAFPVEEREESTTMRWEIFYPLMLKKRKQGADE